MIQAVFPRRPSQRFAWLVSACVGLAVAAVADGAGTKAKVVEAAPVAQDPLELPQVRIDRLDVSLWPKVQILATVLDKLGRPVPLDAIRKLHVLDGKKSAGASKTNPGFVAFDMGKAQGDRKDAKLKLRDKTGVIVDIVLVAEGISGGIGDSTQDRIKEAVAAALKPLSAAERVNLIWYNDRLFQFTALKNKSSQLQDIERTRRDCIPARQQALSDDPLTLAGPPAKDAPVPPVGTDLCGLTTDVGTLAKATKIQQFSGSFPRLFNLGLPFYSAARYCTVPPGALDGFAVFNSADYQSKLEEYESRRAKNDAIDFETSAMDEALRILVADSPSGHERALVLLSDGRDGYVQDLQLCQTVPPKECASWNDGKSKEKFRSCMADFLARRIATQQSQFRDKARHWIGVARAAGVRAFGVGIAPLGKDYELERIRLLSERTGGTYRLAQDEDHLAEAMGRTMAEVTGQIAIEYTHKEEYADPEYAVKLAVDIEPRLGRGELLTTPPIYATRPVEPTWRQSLEQLVRHNAVKLQEMLGYKLYVAVGIGVLVLAGLVALLILVLLIRKLFRK